MILVSAWRHLHAEAPWPVEGHLHHWTYGAACAAHIAWHMAAGIGPQSTYVRHMEASSAVLRLAALSAGAWMLQQ